MRVTRAEQRIRGLFGFIAFSTLGGILSPWIASPAPAVATRNRVPEARRVSPPSADRVTGNGFSTERLKDAGSMI